MNLFTIVSEIRNQQKRYEVLAERINQLEQKIPEREARLQQTNSQQEANAKSKQRSLRDSLQIKAKKAQELFDTKWDFLSQGILSSSLLTLPWHHSSWTPSEAANGYQPLISGAASSLLRIGEITQVQNIPLVDKTIPALVPIRALSKEPKDRMPGHLAIFSNSPESRQIAIGAIQSIALKIISAFPLRQVKAIFLDPVSMGNSFPFNKLPSFISGLKTYTRSDDIREQLQSLTVHIEQVIQNYLGITYQNLEEYNAVKSSISEPYRYLFIADFPSNFDRNSWEDLKSLLVNGAKAGVYVILHIDETLEKPQRDIDYGLFQSYCTVLRPYQNHHFNLEFPNHLPCQILLDQPPPNQQFNQLIEAVSKAFKEIKTETVPFSEFYPEKTHLEKHPWSEDYNSCQEIRAPIGVMGAMERLEFWMGKNNDEEIASQSLLAGKPGAGKSYTLHGIIISLAMRYSPDELEMYLLDFKEGVEFQIYVDPERTENSSSTNELNEEKCLPHAKVISIESDREFGLSVLKSVQLEIEKRGSRFKETGVSDLFNYRQKCSQDKMPRILVVIDEFQYMFLERDAITSELNLIFEDITRRGRAFGVHLLIASQSPNVPNMSRGIYSFIEVRIAQQMDKNTAASVLADGNVDAVDLLDKPGKILYNKNFGGKGHNEIGQVADISLLERRKALLYIQEIATQKNYQRPEPLILFNGSRATQLDHNRQLMQLIKFNHWLCPLELNKQIIKEPDWLLEETPGVGWLGEAMRIGDHTEVIFRRRSRSNLMILGSLEEIAFGIVSGLLLSLVHTYEPQKAEFQIIDLSQENEQTPWHQMSMTFRRHFSQYFPITLGKRVADLGQKVNRAEVILQNVYAEMERRKKQRTDNPDMINLDASLFFVYAIGGLNRAQNLRPIEGNRGEERSEDAKKFLTLIAQGPELGIHTILWLDSLKTWSQFTVDNRAALTHFDLRVAMNMPAEDSRNFLGETLAQNLPRVMAYFCDKATGGNLEKFKPYAVPSHQAFKQYSQSFQNRSF
jgi:S-DNA-T family DNA segregation ATPase FtsK/SpoIIIE